MTRSGTVKTRSMIVKMLDPERTSRMFLKYAVRMVESLRPGERCVITRSILFEIGNRHLSGLMGPLWSPVDCIMENVVGSSYRILVRENALDGSATFTRLEKELEDKLTYVSPDRRQMYVKQGDFFIPRKLELKTGKKR